MTDEYRNWSAPLSPPAPLSPGQFLCAATGGLNWVGGPGAAAGEWVGWAGGGEAEGEVWEVGLGWVSRVVRVGSMAQARAYSR